MVLHSVVGIVFVLSVVMVSGMDINGKGRVRNPVCGTGSGLRLVVLYVASVLDPPVKVRIGISRCGYHVLGLA